MARRNTLPPLPEPLPAPDTHYEIEWGENRKPMREGFTPGRVVAVTSDGTRSCVLITAVNDHLLVGFEGDLERLSGHTPAEQNHWLGVLKHSPPHSGDQIPAPPSSVVSDAAPTQPALFG